VPIPDSVLQYVRHRPFGSSHRRRHALRRSELLPRTDQFVGCVDALDLAAAVSVSRYEDVAARGSSANASPIRRAWASLAVRNRDTMLPC
jgi:hypothetical protein